MDFEELARNRYSCRSFTNQKVDDALVEQIIDAANLAPTAVNKQPFRIFKMETEQAKVAIHAVTTCTFGADTFLVVGSRPEDGWVRPYDNRPFADVDASIVATHMILEIEALGLATTWVGYFDAPKLKELCPAMADYDLIAIFPIGYAAEDGVPSPRHTQRKEKADIVTVL